MILSCHETIINDEVRSKLRKLQSTVQSTNKSSLAVLAGWVFLSWEVPNSSFKDKFKWNERGEKNATVWKHWANISCSFAKTARLQEEAKPRLSYNCMKRILEDPSWEYFVESYELLMNNGGIRMIQNEFLFSLSLFRRLPSQLASFAADSSVNAEMKLVSIEWMISTFSLINLSSFSIFFCLLHG